MNARSTLTELGARGIEIEVDGSDLVVRGADRLTDAEIERLRELKDELITLLRRDDARVSDATRRCLVCGQPARFGFGVRLSEGKEGRWTCAAHRPIGEGRA